MTHKKSTRNFDTVVTDYAMFMQAMRIREWLWEISGMIRRLRDSPNPYYGRTIDGLVLIESYGSPCSVGTPLGKWAATGGGCVKEGWLDLAKERLGLVLLQDVIVTGQGSYGPIWGITKDLEGNPLPPPVWHLTNISLSINSVGAINPTDLLPDELLTQCKAAGLECDYSKSKLMPHEIYSDMAYEYADVLWAKIKAEIKFVAWNDKVDPEWELHTLYTFEGVRKEGTLLNNYFAQISPQRANRGRYYSLRNAQGERVLSLGTHCELDVDDKGNNWVCHDIVGKDGRPPTENEIRILERLFAPHECIVAYEPINC